MTTFSIITCTYNAAKVLQRTLDSVRQQTYPHIEHIIVDGLSTDGTMRMVRQYERKGVVVTSEKDRGLYDAMNKGLRLATGDYLVFLNAGDTLPSPNTLKALAAQGLGEAAVVYGETDIVNADGYNLGRRRLQPPERLSWRSFRHGMLVCHQAFYVRTDIARETPYDLQYRFSADVDWCIRVMRKAEARRLPLHNSHLTLCNYLEGGLTAKNHRASLIERFQVMRRHYGLPVTVAMHAWFLLRSVFS